MKKENRIRIVILSVIALIMLQGCYTKHYALDGSSIPEPVKAETIDLVAGIESIKNETSEQNDLPPSEVVDLLAKRLDEDKVFSAVVYPYTEMAKVDADVILKVSCNVIEDLKMDQNLVKAVLTGLSLYLLSPVLPTEFDLILEIDVEAYTAQGQKINKYQSKSEYRFASTDFLPSEDSIYEWVEDSKKHAVEEMVNEIKNDRESYKNLNGSAYINREKNLS
jgi:hypothetical protein